VGANDDDLGDCNSFLFPFQDLTPVSPKPQEIFFRFCLGCDGGGGVLEAGTDAESGLGTQIKGLQPNERTAAGGWMDALFCLVGGETERTLHTPTIRGLGGSGGGEG